jgi:hypothetical protein
MSCRRGDARGRHVPGSEREKSIMRTVIIAASAVAALFSSAAFAQPPSQDTASIPDFSGIWAHLTFPDVEPPLSGAGPVRNLSRVSIEVARTLNPYNGAATDGASPNGISNSSELVGDFTNPILKPEAAEVVKQHGEISKKKILSERQGAGKRRAVIASVDRARRASTSPA